VLAVWAGFALFFVATIIAAIWRCRAPEDADEVELPPCSVVLPIKGRSQFLGENLTALARLKALKGEILVCVAQEGDPAVEIVVPIIRAHPDRMQLLVGEAGEFTNPKLRNIAKGYRAARNETVLFVDDSSSLDAGVYRELLISLRPGTALVTAAPLSLDAGNFAAELEAATWNGYLIRLEMFLALFGKAAAFGNAIAFRKQALEDIGGFKRMAEGPCEDNALSKALRAGGGRLVLTRSCVRRRIGRRGWKETWDRHVRWKNCARVHDPLAFAVEPFVGGLWFNLLGAYALSGFFAGGAPAALVASMVFYYGLEAALSLACGWPFRPVTPLAWIARDLAHPVFSVAATLTRRLSWRGEIYDMDMRD
jgi:ceramide glucosyltransferase